MKKESQNKILLWRIGAGVLFDIDAWDTVKVIFEGAWAFSWPLIKLLWPLWVIIGAIALLRIVLEILLPNWVHNLRIKKKFNERQKWHSDRDLIYWLRGMNPSDFEQYIADLFSKLGFKTKVVGGGYDRGVDVIAEKDGIKHYIQCKKFITSVVNVHDIRDFYGAIADHLADAKAYFITTNKFTLEAEKFAEDKPIELIDGSKLIKYIRLSEKKENKNSVRSDL